MSIESRIEEALEEAENKAWDALSRYKFQMFGYWAAIWVHLNRIVGENRPNPWRCLVKIARQGHVLPVASTRGTILFEFNDEGDKFEEDR